MTREGKAPQTATKPRRGKDSPVPASGGKPPHDTKGAALQVINMPIQELVPYAQNARTHSEAQITQIAASILEFGWTNPILVDGANGVMAGHGRLLAARKLGLREVPIIEIGHLTPEQKRAYIIADNKLALNAGWDPELLALELRHLDLAGVDLAITGFDAQELEQLLSWAPAGSQGLTARDAAPQVPAVPVSAPGDVWILGQHRVVCGDATHAATLERLMAGEKARAVWTDPPYNVAYGGKAEMLNDYQKGHRNTSRILNDDLAAPDFRLFLRMLFRVITAVLEPGSAVYVAHAETERANFTREFVAAGFKLAGVVIWKKNAMVLGRSDYQWIHEPILYGWKPGAAHRWYGGRKNVTVESLGTGSPFVQRADGKWELSVGSQAFVIDGSAKVEELATSVVHQDKPRTNDVHPTMKPVALVERMLRNSAKAGDIVLDPCGGSGSTLIAAECLNMQARLAELDPLYVDVIVRRWEDFTGKEAMLENSGMSFYGAREIRGAS